MDHVDATGGQGEGRRVEVGEDAQVDSRFAFFLAGFGLFFGQLHLERALRQADLDAAEFFEGADFLRVIGTEQEVVLRLLEQLMQVEFF